jgi:hypothetical protein
MAGGRPQAALHGRRTAPGRSPRPTDDSRPHFLSPYFAGTCYDNSVKKTGPVLTITCMWQVDGETIWKSCILQIRTPPSPTTPRVTFQSKHMGVNHISAPPPIVRYLYTKLEETGVRGGGVMI